MKTLIEEFGEMLSGSTDKIIDKLDEILDRIGPTEYIKHLSTSEIINLIDFLSKNEKITRQEYNVITEFINEIIDEEDDD